MLQLTQLKLLSLIAALLLSILGIMAYEHRQAEAERQRAETQRHKEEQWKRELLREEQDPHRPQLQTSDSLRKY